MSRMPLRLVAVDDHPIVVAGLVALLTGPEHDLDLVHTATSWPALEAALVDLDPPDLALVDLNRSDGTAPEVAVAGLSARGIPVVILTSEMRPVPIRRAIAAGARGLALKSDPVEDILDVIRTTGAGEQAWSSDLAFALLSDRNLVGELAPRELEALSLLAEGWPRKSIGRRMDPPVSTTTVITYLNRAVARYRGLGRAVDTPGDAVRAATADGWIDGPQTPRVLHLED